MLYHSISSTQSTQHSSTMRVTRSLFEILIRLRPFSLENSLHARCTYEVACSGNIVCKIQRVSYRQMSIVSLAMNLL
jgi:hypothetical protein